MHEPYLTVKVCAMRQSRHTLQRDLYAVAEGQGGYFTAAQAKAVGYSYPAQAHHVGAGNWIRVGRGIFRDPAVKRHASAEEPDTSVLAIGGPRDAAYEPSAWEHAFAAEKHRVSGDYEAMAAEIAAGLEQHPDDPALLYNLGCAEALAGRPEDAIEHVRRAIALKPEWEDDAYKDEDLLTLRELLG